MRRASLFLSNLGGSSLAHVILLSCRVAPQAADDKPATPLEIFLATSMLATDTETQDAKSDAKVEARPPLSSLLLLVSLQERAS